MFGVHNWSCKSRSEGRVGREKQSAGDGTLAEAAEDAEDRQQIGQVEEVEALM